jgi:hypothetical protein
LNIRSINSETKQLAIREKIQESSFSVMGIQETKRELFDYKFIRSFCPKQFYNFAFSLSIGVSGGIIVVWISSAFHGTLIEVQRFAIVLRFQSAHSDKNGRYCVYMVHVKVN